MEKNALILMKFDELLERLDARTNVCIFLEDQDKPLKLNTKVYELLSDEAFLEKYSNYDVKGLTGVLGITNILIKEA